MGSEWWKNLLTGTSLYIVCYNSQINLSFVLNGPVWSEEESPSCFLSYDNTIDPPHFYYFWGGQGTSMPGYWDIWIGQEWYEIILIGNSNWMITDTSPSSADQEPINSIDYLYIESK